MLKPLSMLSVTAITLFTASQAHSHVLCLPNTVQPMVHSHNQAYTVPRIQPVVNHVVSSTTVYRNQNNPQHLAAQRARQQQALANQRRINEQRRLQAQKIQQQVAARKAEQIRQQQAAAKRAQAARQRAALQAAKRKAALARQATQARRYQQTQVVRQQPARNYYVPNQSSVTVSVNTHNSYHSHNPQPARPMRQQQSVLHYPNQPTGSSYIVCEPCYQ